MAAEPNVAGIARLLYLVAGTAAASWGLWGADHGWTWVILGGILLVCGAIGYLPLHTFSLKSNQRAG